MALERDNSGLTTHYKYCYDSGARRKVNMSRIFISYRQEDSGGYNSQLCRRLQDDFGEENVFFDIKSIGLGADWWQVVEEKIRSCNILLAPVGPTWLTIEDKNGNRRLDNPKDPLRREIETALKANLL